MRLSEKKVNQQTMIFFGLGVGLSIVLALLSTINLHDTPDWMILILLVLIGIVTAGGMGLVLDRSSRISGILLLSLALSQGAYLVYLSLTRGIEFSNDLLLASLLISGGVTAYFVLNKQFDRISFITRNALRVLFLVLLIALTFTYLVSLSHLSPDAITQDYKTDKGNLIGFVIGVGLMIGLYIILLRNIRGIRSSEIFVFGPRRSGKTYFLIGMYRQFVRFYEGSHKELVFCGKKEEESQWNLSNLIAQASEGKSPPSNVTDMVSIYSLLGKQHGIRNVDFTIVDYAGEWVHEIQEKINDKSYDAALEQIGTELTINKAILDANIGSIDYLTTLKKDNAQKIASIIDPLVTAFIYKRLKTAGKIIFLVDGEKIMNYDADSRMELSRLFGYYEQMMQTLGFEKQYAIAVTKTDKIVPLFDISPNSQEAADIENSIREKYLAPLESFLEIEHDAIHCPTYLFTVSATQMNTEERPNDSLMPWRYDEIARFQF